MKKIFWFLSLLAIGAYNLFAQFSDTTELAFIQRVNARGDLALIESNLPNADELSNAMIMNSSNTKIKSLFLYETAVSHYKLNQYAKALYYLLADRLFFPSSVTNGCYMIFSHSAYALNLDSAVVDKLWNIKTSGDLHSDYDKLFYAGASVYSKDLVQLLKQLVLFEANNFGEVAYKMQHWLFLVDIGMRQKQIKKFYDKVEDTGTPVYLQTNIPAKYRKKIARKAIKFYVKKGAYTEACNVMKYYKNMKLNPIQYIGLLLKKIRCSFKF
jgi:hypothetical protein